MEIPPLYPLRFAPIFKSALWGGRRLADFVRGAQPPAGPVGEAWVLSDHGRQVSVVADGPLAGTPLRDLLTRSASRLIGRPAPRLGFPLLLKFLDARDDLSVQVHPDDGRAAAHSSRGKTEAWVVLHADPGARVYAGLKPGVGPAELRHAVAAGGVAGCLHSFQPRPGDCLFLPAGTVHALGAGLVVFEVQQTSDLTYRLHDWDRVDRATGLPRELHLEQALACTDYGSGPCQPLRPFAESDDPARRERLIACEHFSLWRWRAGRPFLAGTTASCRVLVGVEGRCAVEHRGRDYPLNPGDVLMLPAEVGACVCRPLDGHRPAIVLECGLPERATRAVEAA